MYFNRVAVIKGKRRVLTVPSGRVRCAHEVLLPWLNLVPLHETAHGFVSGRSIVTNAKPHLGAALVISFDIKSFFPSVTLEAFSRTCEEILSSRLPSHLLPWVYSTCFWEGSLPQGSSCSPVLSNIFLTKFDEVTSAWCSKRNITYTRYADDMTFSYSSPSQRASEIKNFIADSLQEYGLELNRKKTLVRPSHQNQMVTGISVNNGQLRVSRKKREQFYLNLKGRQYCSLDSSELGFLSFVKSVDERFYDKIWKVLSHQT
jgi:retron-type reverse transcriptase